MNDFQAKQEAKRERLEARATKARATAIAAGEQRRRIGAMIPMGQPILVGHHSEKRHRRDIARIDAGFRREYEGHKEAERLDQQAAAVGTGGISSDDPEAIRQLKEKLEGMEAKREEYKAHNKQAKKQGQERLPSYLLSNLGANIRRVRKRLEELEAHEARTAAKPIEGEGWRIEECKDDNRVRFYFDERPSKEACKTMRSLGFKWAPSVGAWQRQLHNGSVYAAREAARTLFGTTVR